MDVTQPETPREGIVPLDSAIRTTAIHPLLPDIRVPGQTPQDQDQDPAGTGAGQKQSDDNDNDNNATRKTFYYHPVTCQPLDMSSFSEEQKQELDSLRDTYTPSAAQKAQDQTAHDAKARIESISRRRDEVQRAIDKKVKERNTEMKVLEKYQGDTGVKTKGVVP